MSVRHFSEVPDKRARLRAEALRNPAWQLSLPGPEPSGGQGYLGTETCSDGSPNRLIGAPVKSKKHSNSEKKARIKKTYRFDRDAYLIMHEKALAARMTDSEFFRQCVLTNRTAIYLAPEKQDRRLAYLFAKASNNLNQLAHRAHLDNLKGTLSEASYERLIYSLERIADIMGKAVRNDNTP